jgi:hypothetical protein
MCVCPSRSSGVRRSANMCATRSPPRSAKSSGSADVCRSAIKISATYRSANSASREKTAFVLVPRYVAEEPAADIGCSRLAELRVESGNQALAKTLSWRARNYLLRKTLRLSKSADLNQGLNLVKTRRHVAYHEM